MRKASKSIVVREPYFRYGEPARLSFDENVRKLNLDYIITACISTNDPFQNEQCPCVVKCRFPDSHVRDALVRVWLRPMSSEPDKVDNSYVEELIDPKFSHIYLLDRYVKGHFIANRLLGEVKSLENNELSCVICEQNTRTHALVPCGHYCFCVECIRRFDKLTCPLCGQLIDNAIHIFQT